MNTVKQPVKIDTSILRLDGKLVRLQLATPTAPPPGTTATRAASDGTPPYTYAASSNVVQIDRDTGYIMSFRNGQATITVTDTVGHSASYVVQVSNVFELDPDAFRYSYQRALKIANDLAGRVPSLEDWEVFRSAYNGDPPTPGNAGNVPAWSTTPAGDGLLSTIVPKTGEMGTAADTDDPNDRDTPIGWVLYHRFTTYPRPLERAERNTQALETLAIVTVQDTTGEVSHGGVTTDTTLTLWGTAAPNRRVEFLDGAVVIRNVTADAGGEWTFQLHDLAMESHSFKLRDYQSIHPESAVYEVIVVGTTDPVIKSVRDSLGELVNGTTLDTAVTLSGTALANEAVELFDDATSKGTATVDANGQWTLLVDDLAVGPHSFKARGNYDVNPESAELGVYVADFPTLRILNVYAGTLGGGVALPEGGTTAETTIRITGYGPGAQIVEIFDGTTSKGTATVDRNSFYWLAEMVGVAVGPHSVTARERYGSQAESDARTFTVTQL